MAIQGDTLVHHLDSHDMCGKEDEYWTLNTMSVQQLYHLLYQNLVRAQGTYLQCSLNLMLSNNGMNDVS